MKENSVKQQVLWFTLINYIGVAIGIISTLFIYPENTRYLGLIRTIESYSQLFYPIILIGAAQALVHFYPTLDSIHKRQLFGYSLYSVFINSVIVGLIVVGIALASSTQNQLILISALLMAMAIAANEVFKRQALNHQKIALPTLYEKILPKIALPLSFLLIGWNYFSDHQGIALFITSYFALMLLTGFYLLKFEKSVVFDRKQIFESLSKKEYYRYSIFSFLGSLGSLLAFRIDTIMLNILGYPMSEIGVYNIGVLIASTLIIPAQGLYAINSPTISRLIKENKLRELGIKYTESAKLMFAIGALLYGCMFLGIEDLFSLLPAKDNLLLAIPTLLVLGLGVVVNMSTGFNSEIITYSRYYTFNVVSILLMIVLNIGLNLYFLKVLHLGPIGVAYATLVAMSIFNLVKTIFIYKKYQLLPFDLAYLKLLAVISCTTLGFYLLPNLDHHFLNLIYKSGGCLIVVLVLIYRLRLLHLINQSKWFKKS